MNAVSAGVVETEALDHFPNREEMLGTVTRTPAGRLVSPEDVAAGRDPALARAVTLAGGTLDAVTAGKMFPPRKD